MQPEERRVVSVEEWQQLRRQRVEATLKLDPAVSIELDGKPYTLVCNMKAAKGLYRDTGHSILSHPLSTALGDPIIFSSMLLNFLSTHHPELTQDQIDLMASGRHYLYLSDKLLEAARLFTPDMTDVVTEEQLKAEAEARASAAQDPTVKPVPAG